MKLLSCMSAQMHDFSCLCFSIPPHVRTNWCNSTRLDLNREDGAYLWLLLESSPSLDPTEQEQKTLYIWLKEKVSVATLTLTGSPVMRKANITVITTTIIINRAISMSTWCAKSLLKQI